MLFQPIPAQGTTASSIWLCCRGSQRLNATCVFSGMQSEESREGAAHIDLAQAAEVDVLEVGGSAGAAVLRATLAPPRIRAVGDAAHQAVCNDRRGQRGAVAVTCSASTQILANFTILLHLAIHGNLQWGSSTCNGNVLRVKLMRGRRRHTIRALATCESPHHPIQCKMKINRARTFLAQARRHLDVAIGCGGAQWLAVNSHCRQVRHAGVPQLQDPNYASQCIHGADMLCALYIE